ncbi:glycosyltransferase [Marivirga sp.]|uniref:glycosyltransferase n=1 Tax=Marivirga sp. TaxID=2018662 RepID=UPI003DA75C81
MKIFIVAHNINSAGITSQTNNLLRELESREDLSCKIVLPDHSGFSETNNLEKKGLSIVKVPYPKNRFLRLVLRIIYDFLLIPGLIIAYNPKAVLAIANYMPTPVFFRKKIILIRHPYLLKKDLSKNLPLFQRMKEQATRLLLKLTLTTTDLVIVQSQYMKDSFQQAFNNKTPIIELPNPLSRSFVDKERPKEHQKSYEEGYKYLFYPSRFYPHKNHLFINNIIDKYSEELKTLKIKIIVTLGGESLIYLSGYEKELYNKITITYEKEPFNNIIMNIGEVSQTELIKYYQKSSALFFPSSEETFGNGLIEGMFFKLPILVPKLDYAMTICGNAGVYFEPDNVDSAFVSIKKIVSDRDFSVAHSILSEKRFSKFILTNEWIDILVNKINSLSSKQ